MKIIKKINQNKRHLSKDKRYIYNTKQDSIIIIDKQDNKEYILKLKLDKENILVIHKLLEIMNNQDIQILNLKNAIESTIIPPKKQEAEIIDIEEEYL